MRSNGPARKVGSDCGRAVVVGSDATTRKRRRRKLQTHAAAAVDFLEKHQRRRRSARMQVCAVLLDPPLQQILPLPTPCACPPGMA